MNSTAQITKPKIPKKPFMLHLSLDEQILFLTQLSLMIKSGIPVLQSLKLIEKQALSNNTKYIIERIASQIENGVSLSKSIEEFRKIFGDFVINVIKIADTTGGLEKNLLYLGDELKKRQKLRRKVRGALIYPVVIMIATFGITGVLTLYVFPKVLPIFSNLKFDLPWSTKFLIFISNSALNYWWAIIGAAGLALLSGSLLLRVKFIKAKVDRWIMRTPAIGGMIRSYNLANFCRTLGLLLKSGVHIEEAAEITAQTTPNLAYKEEVLKIKKMVTTGERTSKLMEKDRFLFPDILTQMISVGEGTGNLGQSFTFLAELYENEVDDKSQNLSTILEPALMIVMGLLVGFIAIAIITPIYEVTQHITPQ
ncbi:MAG TPA: type II secretion system F family protein [Patescibacteria group bacterium]|nr:type II secretion system F family protein [Patescibacteria group bacterium]